MNIFKCTKEQLDITAEFYDKVTEYLEKNINYPKWVHGEYPGRESTELAIENGEQYICTDGEKVVGAFILNNNPKGDYSAGDWSRELREYEYLVIHTLASDPEMYNGGIAKAMVKYCINTAKKQGFKALRLDVVPTNVPATGLYKSMGFTFAGRKDLLRNIEDIPMFDLYEINFDK